MKFIHPDSRSKFAVWCINEGWVPSFNKVDVFHTYDQAKEYMDSWKKDNLLSKYEVREIVNPDQINFCGKEYK